MRRELLRAEFANTKPEGRRKEILWFSGVDVPRFDFWTGDEWILRLPMDVARLDRLNSGSAPLLKDHVWNRPIDSQVGIIERAWIDGSSGFASVRFADTEDVDDIWRKVDSGIIQNVSMETVIDDLKDVTPPKHKTRILAATGWEPEAVAIVPVGADPNAGFLSVLPVSNPSTIPIQDLLDKRRASVNLIMALLKRG